MVNALCLHTIIYRLVGTARHRQPDVERHRDDQVDVRGAAVAAWREALLLGGPVALPTGYLPELGFDVLNHKDQRAAVGFQPDIVSLLFHECSQPVAKVRPCHGAVSLKKGARLGQPIADARRPRRL